MDINFPINKLLDRGLTADDFTIASLLKEKKYGILKDYVKLLGDKFYNSISRLKELGYIDYMSLSNIVPVKEIKVTDSFTNIIINGDNFEEFYQAFPTKVTRPDGNMDYLRRDKLKCKTKYKRITKNNLLIHDHIMDCLNFEVNSRSTRDNMAYMKRMKNWLDAEEWKVIDEYRQKIANKDQSLVQGSNTYGTTIL